MFKVYHPETPEEMLVFQTENDAWEYVLLCCRARLFQGGVEDEAYLELTREYLIAEL